MALAPSGIWASRVIEMVHGDYMMRMMPVDLVYRDADFSGLGGGVDENEEVPSLSQGARSVRNTDMKSFREKL